MAVHPLQRLLLDVESLAVRFEILRLELVEVVWQLRQQANHAALVEQQRQQPAKRARAKQRQSSSRKDSQ